MLKIALIDDKYYGIKQIQDIHIEEEFELKHFYTFEEFKKHNKKYDIVYLDYYLEKDGITGDRIIDEVKKQTIKVIGYSSVERCCKILKEKGADGYVIKN